MRAPLATAAALAALFFPPAGAWAQSVTTLPGDLEELVAGQSVAMEGMLLGSAIPAAGHSVSFLPWIGGYGQASEGGTTPEAAGLGLAWRLADAGGRPLVVGAGASDIGIVSWTAFVGHTLGRWTRGRATWELETALGYQLERHDDGDRASLGPGPDPPPGEPGWLVESLQLGHLRLQARGTARFWVLEPRLELGTTLSAYRFEGQSWDESFPLGGGAKLSEKGVVLAPSLGFGLGVGRGGLRGFAGVHLTRRAGGFQLGASVLW